MITYEERAETRQIQKTIKLTFSVTRRADLSLHFGVMPWHDVGVEVTWLRFRVSIRTH